MQNEEVRRQNTGGVFFAFLMVAGVLAVWEVSVHLTQTPVYILPAPSRVAQTLFSQPVYFLTALLVTLGEALAGLTIGTLVGITVAALISLKPQLERGVMTLAILVKSTPLAAIAPLLTIWLGFAFCRRSSSLPC
jgi:ABC-type nitrate/sulfonate/bicarbonate transport system permease component